MDGRRGSATQLIEERVHEMISNGLNMRSDDGESLEIPQHVEAEQLVRHQLMRKVFHKYQLMIVRMKLSYSALVRS